MSRRRHTPRKNQSGNLGHGFRGRNAAGTYEDLNKNSIVSQVSEPSWYTDEPGTMLMTTCDLDVGAHKTNEFPRAVVHAVWSTEPAQFPLGTFVLWMGLERVEENEPNRAKGFSRRVLKPIYLLGGSRVIIDYVYLKDITS